MTSKTTIPTLPGMGRSIIDHDPRNREHPTRGVLHAADAPLRERTWRRGAAYDQGRTTQCVAYEAKGKLNTAPFSAFEPYHRRSRYSTDDFYAGAQANDEWPGTDYDGTSARGVLRHLTDLGIISEYRWCFGLQDVLQTLSHHGPVGVGSWWRGGMWEPDPDTGLIRYSGSYEGGHQWQLIGVDPRREEVIGMNSWGTSWGVGGRFRLSFADLEAALADDGDAHTLVVVN